MLMSTAGFWSLPTSVESMSMNELSVTREIRKCCLTIVLASLASREAVTVSGSKDSFTNQVGSEGVVTSIGPFGRGGGSRRGRVQSACRGESTEASEARRKTRNALFRARECVRDDNYVIVQRRRLRLRPFDATIDRSTDNSFIASFVRSFVCSSRALRRRRDRADRRKT